VSKRRGRRRLLGRRLQLLLVLAVVAAALGAVTASGASFVSTSSTTVKGSTSTLGADIMTVVSATEGQSAVAGTAVPLAPSVYIRDGSGNPVSGLTVTFTVMTGGGSMSSNTDVTDDSGVATAGAWTLGSSPGANSVQVTRTGVQGSPRTITATGVAGSPVKIALNAGDGQSAVAGSNVATAPSVKVTDAGGNPCSGVSVTFAVASGGGSVTGGSATTNAAGIATVGSWKLGATVGANTLTATSGTLSGSPVTFNAVGTVGPASKITMNAGSGQTVHVGTAVTLPPSVLVTDANNNPVSGVGVTFAVNSGGGSVTGGAATTNAAGIATVGSWTLGTTVGANTLTATLAGVTGSPVTFTATGTVGAASKLTLSTGSGQTATVGTAVATAPRVFVTDAYNNPVSGVAVTFAVASGGGSVTGASTTTSTSGLATVGSWTLGTAAGANSLTATSTGLTGSPVTFTATGAAGAATKYLVTSSSYNPVAGTAVAISAQLADQYNNPVATSGIAVTFTKTGTGGTLGTPNPATTSAAGVATVTFTTQATVGLAYTVTATSTAPSTRIGSSATITTR